MKFKTLLQLTWALTKEPVGRKSLSGPTAELPQQGGKSLSLISSNNCHDIVSSLQCKVYLPLAWRCFVRGELLFLLSQELHSSGHTSLMAAGNFSIQLSLDAWVKVEFLPDLPQSQENIWHRVRLLPLGRPQDHCPGALPLQLAHRHPFQEVLFCQPDYLTYQPVDKSSDGSSNHSSVPLDHLS